MKCIKCGELIYLSYLDGWIHYHIPHNDLKKECKVCKCEKAIPPTFKEKSGGGK